MSEDEKDGKPEKPFFVSRCLAFVIDMFIVLLLSSMIATPFVDANKMLTLREQSVNIVEKYQKNEMTDKEYLVEISNLEYMMARSTELVTIIMILISVLNFVVLPLYNKGQSIGKKLFKLKIVSDTGELNANQLLFRTFIANFLLLNIISILFIMFADRDVYMYVVELFTFAQYIITFGSIIMIAFGKEGLAIHDKLVHTKVVKVN